MQLTVESTILDVAQGLGPLIRQHAEEAERGRRLARPVLDALVEAGLFRLYVPRSLGGLEVDPVTCARVIETISTFDSAAGWAILNPNFIDWWCARLPEEGVAEIYADGPDAIIATAFHPPMQAAPAPGGYRINGRSPLASTGHDAGWFLFTALVMDGDQPKLTDGAPEVIGAFLRARECRIIDTWDALGMRGTDSNDVAVDGVFVPGARTFPIVPAFQPGRHYQGALYRMPAMGAVVAPGAPIALAIARAAIEEFRSLAQEKTPFVATTVLRERAPVQAKVGQAEALVRSARALLYETIAEAWERTLAGEPSSLEQKADLVMAATQASQSAAKAVELIFGAAGTSAVYTRSPLERHFRDAQVLKQHGFYAEGRYETVGQVYLGLPPDLGFVVF